MLVSVVNNFYSEWGVIDMSDITFMQLIFHCKNVVKAQHYRNKIREKENLYLLESIVRNLYKCTFQF